MKEEIISSLIIKDIVIEEVKMKQKRQNSKRWSENIGECEKFKQININTIGFSKRGGLRQKTILKNKGRIFKIWQNL